MGRGQVEGRMFVPRARDAAGEEGTSPRPRAGAVLCVGKLVQVGRAEGVG